MSVRLRLTCWYAALLGLILAIGGSVAYFAHAGTHIADDDVMLENASRPFATVVGGDLVNRRFPTADELRDVAPPTSGLGVALADADGRVVVAEGDLDLTRVDPLDLTFGDGFMTVLLPGGRARLLVETLSDDGWRLLVGTSLADLDESLTELRGQFLFLTLGGVVVALAGGSIIAEGALRPIASVTETAEAIRSARSFTRRVRRPERNDEVGQLTRTFNGMLDTLQEMYERERRFVSDASHELRTPLTAARANVELLAKARTESERAELVVRVEREMDRLTRLVDELLMLARADASPEPLRASAVQLDEVVMEAFEEVRARAGDRLRVVDLEGATVRGERDRLKQLVLILLDNAIRYTPAPRAIEVSLGRGTSDASLVVTDDGIGIGPDDVPRAFDRFFRGERARRLEPSGSGLGLAIARWIVERHGGAIEIEPRRPRGTRVAVTLPLATARAAA